MTLAPEPRSPSRLIIIMIASSSICIGGAIGYHLPYIKQISGQQFSQSTTAVPQTSPRPPDPTMTPQRSNSRPQNPLIVARNDPLSPQSGITEPVRMDGPSPNGSPAKPISMVEFGRIIRDRISETVKNPDVDGGTATIRFTINGKGVVVSSSLIQTSSIPEIDEAAMDAVKIGRQIAVPPASLKFGTQSFTLPLSFHGDGQPHPSYNCSRAERLDEIAICEDVNLARMERAFARTLRAAKDLNEAEKFKSFESTSSEIKRCFNDKVCIFDALKYTTDENMMSMLDKHRRKLVTEATKRDLALKSLNSVGLSGSFTLSAKGVNATLIDVDGLDSTSASARGEIQRNDHAEYCDRDSGGSTKSNGGRMTIDQCVAQSMKGIRRTNYQSGADCRARTVRLWDGMWRLKRVDEDYMRVWINSNGVEVEPSNFSAAVDAHFELLCPQTNARIRAGLEQVSARSGSRRTGRQ